MITTFSDIKKLAKNVVLVKLVPNGMGDHVFTLTDGTSLEIHYEPLDGSISDYEKILNTQNVFPNLQTLIDSSIEGTSVNLSKSSKKLKYAHITFSSVQKYAKHLQKVNLDVEHVTQSNIPRIKTLFPNGKVLWDADYERIKVLVKSKVSPKASSPKASSPKACPPGKILNPKTGRCVKRDGKIGRAILGPKNR